MTDEFDLRTVLPLLLPGAIAWAEARSLEVSQQGTALDADGISIARQVGVQRPELVRIAVVDSLPLPEEANLKAAALQTGLLGPEMVGLTLGYSVFICRGHQTRRLLSHELRHVHQYEAHGSIAEFLPVYLQQIAEIGYTIGLSVKADAVAAMPRGSIGARDNVVVTPTLVGPFEGARMARREFQMPSVLQHDGTRPYWYIRYRQKVLVGKDQIERKEIWHPLGYCDEVTKREAMRLREEVLHQVNNQVFTIQSQIPFEEFVKMYSEHHLVTLAPGGRKRDLSLLKNHILPAFTGRKLCEVGTQEIQAFLNAKDAKGLSYWTRKAMHAILGSLFTKADDWGYWNGSRNPVSRVRVGRKRLKREKRILDDDQLRALLAELPPDIGLMVRTAVSTGMRVSEILGLKWRAVDLEHGLVHVQERYYRGDTDEPKTDKSRRPLPLGYLTKDVRELRLQALEERDKLSGHEYVFHKDGKPLDDRDVLRDIIRPAAERLELYFEGFGWHSFRRQNITLMQEEGATTFEAMEQAGHTRSTMTSEYTIVALARREQAVRRVQERLFGKQEKKGPKVVSLTVVRDSAG